MTLWRVRHGFDTTVEAATEEQAREIGEQAFEQYGYNEPEPLVVERHRVTVVDYGPEAIRWHFDGDTDENDKPIDRTKEFTDDELAEAADIYIADNDPLWDAFGEACESILDIARKEKERKAKEAVTAATPG